MTAPVLTKVIHGAGPNCASTFVMHFMLTFDQWAEPIPPTDSSVYIVETPQMDVYVRSAVRACPSGKSRPRFLGNF